MFLYSVCKLWLQLHSYKHIESTLKYLQKHVLMCYALWPLEQRQRLS